LNELQNWKLPNFNSENPVDGLILSGVRACLATLVRRVLRVSGSGMKSHCASAPVPPEPLQPVRHGKIERMNGEPLALLDRVLLQLESL
jgi:hypothetical protein